MKNLSLFQKLVLPLMVMLFLILALLGVGFYHISAQEIRHQTEAETQEIVKQSSYFLEFYLKKVKETSTSLVGHSQVKDYSQAPTLEKEASLRELFATMIDADKDLVSAVLVTKSGQVIATDSSISMKTSSDMMAESWYQEAIDTNGSPVLIPAQQGGRSQENQWLISVTQEVRDKSGKNLGVLRLDLSYDTLANYLDHLKLGEDGFAFILNEQKEFVYHPQHTVYLSSQEMKEQEPFIQEENGYVAGNTYVYQNDIPGTTWRLIGVASLEALGQLQTKLMKTFLGLSFLALLLTASGLWIILRQWARPLKDFQQTILKVGTGQVHLRAKEEGAPELVQLASNFNQMLNQMEQLMLTIKEEEQEVRRYELRALASQINPHFLYNTLDTIVWMAELQKGPKVVELTKSLAHYFRLALNRGHEQIRLQDEIDHVRQYLFIQQERYGKKLTYEIRENPDFADFLLPKLVLQPLVENAIYHGIKQIQGTGIIKINVRSLAGNLVISVSDNGPGFAEVKEEEIRLKLGGVGLTNVDQRLKLQFGDDYHMEIQSPPDGWTTVSLCFKMNRTD
ncbi:cache domain-containing sensor histidine kinase [Streptococcus sp. 10F2]